MFTGLQTHRIKDKRKWDTLLKTKNLIFFNFHKACNDSRVPKSQKPLETVRISQSLTSGVLVVSEEVNDLDAKLFEGMVLFEKNMWQNYDRWSSKITTIFSSSEKLSAWSAKAFQLFKTNFQPQKVMLEAEAWDGGYMWRSHTCSKRCSCPFVCELAGLRRVQDANPLWGICI